MQTVTTIGFDIAKSVFQVHGVDAADQVVIRRQLKRRQVLTFFEKLPPCLVGIDATSCPHSNGRRSSGSDRSSLQNEALRSMRSKMARPFAAS